MAEVKYNLGTLAVVPSGAVIPFAGSTAPQGYLLCDGREVSRADYPYLFDAIGTTYGEGDGNTTFNLPNLQDKFIEGAGINAVGTEKSAGLPNVTGQVGYLKPIDSGNYNQAINIKDGCFKDSKNITTTPPTQNVSGSTHDNTNKTGVIVLDASLSNSIYGNSDTVQPPAICMNYIIKY